MFFCAVSWDDLCSELVLHKWTKFNKGKWKITITFKSCYIVNNDVNTRRFIWTRAENNQFSCKLVQSLLFVQQCPRSLTSHHLSQSLSCDQAPWWYQCLLVLMYDWLKWAIVKEEWCVLCMSVTDDVSMFKHAGHSDNVQSSGVCDSFSQTQLKQLCTAVCMSEVSYFHCLSANQSLDAAHCTVVVPGHQALAGDCTCSDVWWARFFMKTTPCWCARVTRLLFWRSSVGLICELEHFPGGFVCVCVCAMHHCCCSLMHLNERRGLGRLHNVRRKKL